MGYESTKKKPLLTFFWGMDLEIVFEQNYSPQLRTLALSNNFDKVNINFLAYLYIINKINYSSQFKQCQLPIELPLVEKGGLLLERVGVDGGLDCRCRSLRCNGRS